MSATENPADEFTIKAASALRNLKPATAYEWCRTGKLPARRSGPGSKAEYLIKLSDLDQFLATRTKRRAGTVPESQTGVEKAVATQPSPPVPPTQETQTPDPAKTAPSPTSPAKPSKHGKTAMARQKDQMRKLSVPEMVDIINWLSNRIGMQWDAKTTASRSSGPAIKTNPPIPHPTEDQECLF